MSEFFHPAAITLFAIVAVGALQLFGALIARPHFRQLNEIYDQVKADPESNSGDRAWLSTALADATDRGMMWSMVVVAPILAVVLPVIATAQLLKRPTIEGLDRDYDAIQRLRAKAANEIDPSTGHFWRSPLRSKAQNAAHAAEWLQSPLMAVWVGLWLLPGFLISLVVSGALHVALEQYRLLTETVVHKLQSAWGR